MKCSNCSREWPDEYKACPICASPLTAVYNQQEQTVDKQFNVVRYIVNIYNTLPLWGRVVLLIILVSVVVTLFLVVRDFLIPPPLEGKTLFFENFEGSVEPWELTGDCADSKCTFANGALRVNKMPTEIRIPNSVLYENFLFEAKVTSREASTNWKVALRLLNFRDEYYFFIVSRRYGAMSFYQLSKLGTDGNLADLIPPTEIYDARFKKPGTLNTVKIIVRGPKMGLYFNDELLDTFKESYDVDGRLAFIALNGSQIVFDDIRVASLE